MNFDGGYYMITQDLIRTGINSHTAKHPAGVSETMLSALNGVQNVAWRVNGWILDTMYAVWERGNLFGVLPPADDEELPPRQPDDAWRDMDAISRRDWKLKRLRVHNSNASLGSKRQSFLRKIRIATTERDEPAIYFPHFFDFRGRIYPLPQDLQPQADDIGRSLIEFAEGKPLGDRGIFWLAVRLANTFGLDKLSFKDRLAWVSEHDEDIARSGRDPFECVFWCDADEPWGFLATCREWSQLGVAPEKFVSHLPISLDGSINGMQHLSLMGRDPVGAKASNCSASPDRFDMYSQVATEVNKLVSVDAVAGVEAAHHWITQGITRATVKRGVMTTFYGVTNRGLRDQLIVDGFTKDLDGIVSHNATYLAIKLREAMESVAVKATEIMAYFQTVAGALTDAGIEFHWLTPAGMEVWQSYLNLKRSRVLTLMGQFVMWDEDHEMGLAKRKQMLASAPNVIHSFDAAMLALTEIRLRAQGVRSYAFIHDSYGAHAANCDTLARVLREVAAEIYSENQLDKFHRYIKSYAPKVNLPDPPRLGTFNVKEVLKSPYFFS